MVKDAGHAINFILYAQAQGVGLRGCRRKIIHVLVLFFSYFVDDLEFCVFDDVPKPVFTLASEVSVFLSGYSGADRVTLVHKLLERANVNNSVACVLVSSRNTTLPKTHGSWSEKLADSDFTDLYSYNSEFVPLQVFQQQLKDGKYANAKQLVVFTAPQNIVSLVKTEFFTDVILDEEAQEFMDLLKMANRMTNKNGSASSGCTQLEEEEEEEEANPFSKKEQVYDLKIDNCRKQLHVPTLWHSINTCAKHVTITETCEKETCEKI